MKKNFECTECTAGVLFLLHYKKKKKEASESKLREYLCKCVEGGLVKFDPVRRKWSLTEEGREDILLTYAAAMMRAAEPDKQKEREISLRYALVTVTDDIDEVVRMIRKAKLDKQKKREILLQYALTISNDPDEIDKLLSEALKETNISLEGRSLEERCIIRKKVMEMRMEMRMKIRRDLQRIIKKSFTNLSDLQTLDLQTLDLQTSDFQASLSFLIFPYFLYPSEKQDASCILQY